MRAVLRRGPSAERSRRVARFLKGMEETTLKRCARCGHEGPSIAWKTVFLCDPCVRLVVEEWRIHMQDFAELTGGALPDEPIPHMTGQLPRSAAKIR